MVSSGFGERNTIINNQLLLLEAQSHQKTHLQSFLLVRKRETRIGSTHLRQVDAGLVYTDFHNSQDNIVRPCLWGKCGEHWRIEVNTQQSLGIHTCTCTHMQNKTREIKLKDPKPKEMSEKCKACGQAPKERRASNRAVP